MPIYTIDDLRKTAPADLQELDDVDLVREYSRQTGKQFEQVADYLGVKPRGTLGEMGSQVVGGYYDTKKMIGQGLEYTGVAPEYGRELAQEAGAEAEKYAPDMRGRGLLGQALVYGARALPAMAPAIGAAFLPGGQVIAPTVAAGLFGTSSAQETYDKLIAQGASEEDASAAAARVGLVQGPLEAAATYTGLRAAKPVLNALRGARTTGQVAAGLTKTDVLKPVLTGMATNLVVQPGTEVAQDVGTALIEEAYGAAPEDLGEIAKQSALGGVGLTLLLGPLAAGAHVLRAKKAQALKDALYNPDTPLEVRTQAMDLVMGEARRQGIAEEDVDTWFNEQLAAEDARTEALAQQEEQRRNEAIDLLGQEAQGLAGLQDTPFSSTAQQRTFEEGLEGVDLQQPFGSLDQQRTFEEGVTQLRDTRIADVGEQYQDLMGQQASGATAALDAGQQYQGLEARKQSGLQAAQAAGEQYQELRADQLRNPR
jgi:hypothetical protein